MAHGDDEFLGDVHFGPCDTEPDWRNSDIVNEEDTEDEELPETPTGVVQLLGFDPLKEDWGEND